ncbi:unnamed protein product [Didymodactylos carnosus]|uniref:Uncharacterized protein n=1 Tax=Didymodactylos carnosus TaxID=1234261 RepID=A0A814IKH5_9BILA|nr:unnamed protein product [Didymodactylos carnosus]CAF1023955.1 unnamed protein product [Didymodactylos carnosus]CAF3579379.1 unnamed protein product [Didymodactylos carnosus]CAF3795231.1 unnamed protein product [Didymodactylos carnosus]
MPCSLLFTNRRELKQYFEVYDRCLKDYNRYYDYVFNMSNEAEINLFCFGIQNQKQIKYLIDLLCQTWKGLDHDIIYSLTGYFFTYSQQKEALLRVVFS